MSIEDYNKLTDRQKKQLLVDAEKIGEYVDDIASFEVFRLDHFFVEVSKSVTHKFRKILNVYLVNDIPKRYFANLKTV